ncbi:ATP-binding protein [Pseudactinotalea sp. Z1739]|uniref:ATP-binding protein n=1 Tax=Pseudactinotalea sp. Z1739 TaxID=3413028 RepID=UPI003C7DEE72
MQPGPPGSGAGTEAPEPGAAPAGGEPDEFDWVAAQSQFDHAPDDPLFPDSEGPHTSSAEGPHVGNDRYSIDTPAITLADVGGMKTVKDRLNAAFFAPLRNPELRQRFAKTLRGGLLLYGPPGCGKTFIARALAGELGAKFLSNGITDVLDPHFGQSERNLHDAFELARREAPCVLFFDEVDALGGRRSHTSTSMMRTAVNQLLSELDGVGTDNDGVFVLAATNQPWEVDPALRRPGRFDRTVLVLPPDREARAAIFAFHLRTRPTGTIDINALARASPVNLAKRGRPVRAPIHPSIL